MIEQLDKIEDSLSACTVGVTMASIRIGFLGEPSLAKLLEPAFGGLSHEVAAASRWRSRIALVTAVHIVIGEQVPKMLAISHAERTARRVAPPAQLVRRRPGGLGLSRLSNAIVRLFGVDPGDLEERHHGRGPEADHRQLAELESSTQVRPGCSVASSPA